MLKSNRYIVFAYNREGDCGGYKDIVGFADTLGELDSLVSKAMSLSIVHPNVIEIYDIEKGELHDLFLLEDGGWSHHSQTS